MTSIIFSKTRSIESWSNDLPTLMTYSILSSESTGALKVLLTEHLINLHFSLPLILSLSLLNMARNNKPEFLLFLNLL